MVVLDDDDQSTERPSVDGPRALSTLAAESTASVYDKVKASGDVGVVELGGEQLLDQHTRRATR